jgi:hypothetical protein
MLWSPAAPGAAPAGPALLVMAAILYVSSAAGQRTSHPGRSSSLHTAQGSISSSAATGAVGQPACRTPLLILLQVRLSPVASQATHVTPGMQLKPAQHRAAQHNKQHVL